MSSEKYNSDELVPPSFLTKEYFENVLRETQSDPELMVNLSLFPSTRPGSGAGDHYASVTQRIYTKHESKGQVIQRQYFLKTLPDDGQKLENLSEMPLFTNEIRMYREVLPVFEKILREHGEEPWWPRLLYYSEEPLVFIFNDATADGYFVTSEKCNMERIQLLIEKIAKFHAISMILIQEGSLNLNFDNCYAAPCIGKMLLPLQLNLKLFGDTIKTWPGFEEIGAKIGDEKFGEKVVKDMLQTITTPKCWGFNVLNHGDYHLKNIMFRDTAIGQGILFLDFQTPMMNSPAFDLNAMLQSSADCEVREQKDEVVYQYHQLLVENLKNYGFKGQVPSAVDVHVEMLKASSIELYQILCITPIVLIPDLQILNAMENGESTSRGLLKVYTDPQFVQHMQKMLLSLKNRGLFD